MPKNQDQKNSPPQSTDEQLLRLKILDMAIRTPTQPGNISAMELAQQMLDWVKKTGGLKSWQNPN